MARPIPDCAVAFVKGAEACRLTAYQDSGGVWTIGYGHTGPLVHGGLRITQAQADAYLLIDLQEAASELGRRVDAAVLADLTEHQYAALVSFVFNLGAGKPSWTIWKVLNDRQFERVPPQMMRFVYCEIDGVATKLNGLVNRRTAEIKLWSTDEPGSAVGTLPSSQTRSESTPPASTAPKPLLQSKSFVSTVATVTVALPAAVASAAPYADQYPLIAHLSHWLAPVVAACAVVSATLQALKHQQAQV